MIYKFFPAAILAFLLAASAQAAPPAEQVNQKQAKQISELTKRIEDLESQQQDLLNENATGGTQVNSFLRDTLTFGGFFEPGLLVITGPDTKTQAVQTSNLIGLNIGAQFRDHLRFVSQVINYLAYPLLNEHNDPRAAPQQSAQRSFGNPIYGAIVAQAYIEWNLTENVRLQAGLGYVPFGYAFQQREPVLFQRRSGPQLIRSSQIAYALWSGLHLLSTFSEGTNHWGYNFYTAAPTFDSKLPGGGGRLWWANQNDEITVGISSQVGKKGGDTYKTAGADFRFRKLPYLITAEVAKQYIGGKDPYSFYLEPSVDLYQQEFILFVFGDYLKNPQNQTGVIPDPIAKWEYGVGINWLPTSFTRFRFGVTMNDYIGSSSTIAGLNRDYVSFDLSAGVAF